jgi:yeast amino acid transporter
LAAAALTIQYWVPRKKINPGVFITIFLVVVLIINYLGVTYFGELEFWLSPLKVLILCGLISSQSSWCSGEGRLTTG